MKRITQILRKMEEMFPHAKCELFHHNTFELTLAVLLSAQCTDEKVNQVTKQLFQRYTCPEDFLKVDLKTIEKEIQSIGLYRNKAKHIQALCRILVEKYDSEVPHSYEELIQLPGVGRKTANVVRSVGFGVPAIAVDTHVERVSKRLGLADTDDTVLAVEEKLMQLIPKSQWSQGHHLFIFFGRYHCKARNPNCKHCPLLSICDEGQQRLKMEEKE